jgi:hypothetical protein
VALFAEFVAAALDRRADELAQHWQVRAHAATPRRFVATGDEPRGGRPPDPLLDQPHDRRPADEAGGGERGLRDGLGTAVSSVTGSSAVVRAFAAGSPETPDPSAR